MGNQYSFVLKQKQQTVNHRAPNPVAVESNVRIAGKLVEIDPKSGWLKVETGNGTTEFVRFADVERFSEGVPLPMNAPPPNGSTAPRANSNSTRSF